MCVHSRHHHQHHHRFTTIQPYDMLVSNDVSRICTIMRDIGSSKCDLYPEQCVAVCVRADDFIVWSAYLLNTKPPLQTVCCRSVCSVLCLVAIKSNELQIIIIKCMFVCIYGELIIGNET